MFEPVQFNPLIRLSCYQGVELATTRSTNAAKPILSCVHLFACSIETFSSFAIFVQGFRCVTIRYVTIHFQARRSAGSLLYRICAEITVLVFEQKPYAVWFSSRGSSYIV